MAAPLPATQYGLNWDPKLPRVAREMKMIRGGGRWKAGGKTVGLGLFYHMKEFQSLLWPEKVWHKWSALELKCYLKHRIIGVLGPASSGKTFDAATNVLADYYCFPKSTTVLVSSTTKESLEMRVWGEIKAHHKLAKNRFPFLAGNLIEGRQRIVTDARNESSEGRDFRNGLVGVACKRGQNYQGLGEYVGIKNKRLRLLADELQFLPRQFTDAIANLNKNPDFKCMGMGNPKEITDALGTLCEPAPEIGGWDGGIDQKPGTKTWPTRFADGVCIQLPGSDSPNAHGELGIPIITQKHIDDDIRFYGRDSLQFTMMDEGRMPKGTSTRRVITRQMCLKFLAMEEPVWLNPDRVTRLVGIDAAYRGVGGDRCVMVELWFGPNTEGHNIIALVQTDLVPVSVEKNELPEDQIALWVKAQCDSRNIPPDHVFFDSTGRGSLMGAFARVWSPHVVPLEFGGKPTERAVGAGINFTCYEYYSNFVTELWYSIRLVVEAGQFRGMTEEVMGEGCMREWGFQASKIKVEPKDDMKVKSGRSPDLFDALASGVEGARRLGFVIERLGSVAHRRYDDEWKRDLRQRAKKAWHEKDLTYA